MTSVLQFSDVSVVRDRNTILDAVSWTVDSAERWVILGPNGAGKTTLLQLAAAQLHRLEARDGALHPAAGAPPAGTAGVTDFASGAFAASARSTAARSSSPMGFAPEP